MRRVALVTALVAVGLMAMGASVAWGDSLTPMCTIGQGPAQQCTSGWYAGPVIVVWQADTPPINTSGCALGIEYSYESDTSGALSCSASWSDGTHLTYDVPFNVETSSPTATVAPNRAPDSNGWYNHAVAGAVSASSFSGVASCAPTTYAGAPTTTATVAATCVDHAGKTVTAVSAPFAYDATPPTLSATATAGDQSVALSWQAAGDVAPIALVQVTRTGGTTAAAAAATVYSGAGSGFTETHLKNGVHYTYTIAARDAAGNVAVQTVAATPGERLLSPTANAHVTAPPMLTWTTVPGATYYNVQLFRADPTKLLSIWPKHAGLQLRRTWRFDGRRYRLKPGKYRWYVWPGFGRRSAGRYGYMIGSGTFVVVR
jgi:hypothetical protein